VEEAICGPIARYNQEYRDAGSAITVEERLVATLIQQLKEAETGLGRGHAVSATKRGIELPYLQLALTKIWDAEGGMHATVLRETTLRGRLGGVHRIVRDHVSFVMGALSSQEQEICARIFDRLVTAIGSKVAYPTEALAADDVAGADVTQDTIEQILQKLTPKDARILRPVRTNGLPGFEIFHDVLGLPVLEWKRAYQANRRRELDLTQAEARREADLAEAGKRAELASAREKQHEAARRMKIITVASVALLVLSITTGIGALIAYRQSQIAYRQSQEVKAASLRAANEAAAAQAAREVAESARGRGIWVNLDFTAAGLTQGEVQALWKVATAPTFLRAGFLDPLTSSTPDPAVIVTFGRRPQPVMRAIGLAWPPPELAKEQIETILTVGTRLTDPAKLLAWAQAIRAIPAPLTDTQSDAAVSIITSVMARQAEFFGFRESLISNPPVKRSVATPFQTSPSIEPARNVARNLATLAAALHVLSVNLSEAQSYAAFKPVFDAFNTTSDPSALRSLAAAVSALGPLLAQVQSRLALDSLLMTMAQANGSSQLLALVPALRTFKAILTNQEAQAAIYRIWGAVSVSSDPSALQDFADTVSALGSRLAPEQLESMLDDVVSHIEDGNNAQDPMEIGSVGQALAANISTSHLHDIVADGERSVVLFLLVPLLWSVLPQAQSDDLVGQICDVFKTKLDAVDPSLILVLGQSLASAKLSRAQAQQIVETVAVSIKDAKDPNRLAALVELSVSISPRTADTREMLSIVLNAIESTTDPLTVSALAQAVSLFQIAGPKIPAQQAEIAVRQILAAAAQTSNPSVRQSLADGLGSLVGALGPEGNREIFIRVAQQLAEAGQEAEAESWARVATALARSQPDKEYIATILELLKYPTAAGTPTDILMEALRSRFPSVTDLVNLREAVPWFEQNLGIALVNRPPVRP
jgi:hypothetical protein